MNAIAKKTNGNSQAPATSFSGLVDRMFGDNLARFFDDAFWGFNGLSHRVDIPVNVRETEKAYELQLVAPGLKKEDFIISLQENTLTVSFEQTQQEEKQDDQRWLRQQYRPKPFSRSFYLDDSIDAEKINAQYKDGILWLELPRKEGSPQMSKRISVE